MKILFTCVGRRIELIQAFKNAASRLGIELIICGADRDNTAPALYFCDEKVLVPGIYEDTYIPFLANYCLDKKIDAVIPTIDTDLLVLAEGKTCFAETRVIVSDAEVIRICRDKRVTSEFFEKYSLDHPYTVDHCNKYQETFPAFVKPIDGSSSINTFKISCRDELQTVCANMPTYIVQKYISGTEYTVDVLCDFTGNPVFITPRIRLAVRAGEVLKTEISQDEQIIKEIRDLVYSLKPCGPITVQLIRDEASGKDYFIEINPRFGGGAPLSMKAGADSAEAVIRLLGGEKLPYYHRIAEDHAIYSRFDQSIRVDA